MKFEEVYEYDIECSYFKNDKKSDIRFQYIVDCSVEHYELMLERGWRRFGNTFFVPVCKNCNECVTMKIDSSEFKLRKSFKRVKSKNRDIDFVIQRPSISKEHIALYNKYHEFMNSKKDWPYKPITENEYYSSFVVGANSFGYEIIYLLEGEVIGIALVDILQDSLSSVYFFYNPEFQDRSLGIFSILIQMEIAKKLQLNDVYLGYWIKNHYSMGYKERFAPFQVLLNRPEIDEDTIWEDYKIN